MFSCGALHEVTPVTRGKRYAFVPFFYGEEDAALRRANNVYLRDGEARYTAEHDMLFPEIRAPGLVPEAVPANLSEPAEYTPQWPPRSSRDGRTNCNLPFDSSCPTP